MRSASWAISLLWVIITRVWWNFVLVTFSRLSTSLLVILSRLPVGSSARTIAGFDTRARDISGLGPALAQNIVDYRTENGPFRSRQELLKVPRMGAKAFEQCAGFLRIPQAKNPLDNSAVHPESYPIVEQIAKDVYKRQIHIIPAD